MKLDTVDTSNMKMPQELLKGSKEVREMFQELFIKAEMLLLGKKESTWLSQMYKRVFDDGLIYKVENQEELDLIPYLREHDLVKLDLRTVLSIIQMAKAFSA